MCLSITVSQVLAGMHAKWPSVDIKILDLFHHATTKSQVILVSKCLQKVASSLPKSNPVPPIPKTQQTAISPSSINSEIAVVGMAGRFPGASNPEMPFNGAIYVPRRGAIAGVEDFDSAQWGMKEDEARFVQPI